MPIKLVQAVPHLPLKQSIDRAVFQFTTTSRHRPQTFTQRMINGVLSNAPSINNKQPELYNLPSICLYGIHFIVLVQLLQPACTPSFFILGPIRHRLSPLSSTHAISNLLCILIELRRFQVTALTLTIYIKSYSVGRPLQLFSELEISCLDLSSHGDVQYTARLFAI